MFGSVSDTRDTHGGENVGTPIGQCVLIGNFRRRLARELLVERTIYSVGLEHKSRIRFDINGPAIIVVLICLYSGGETCVYMAGLPHATLTSNGPTSHSTSSEWVGTSPVFIEA